MKSVIIYTYRKGGVILYATANKKMLNMLILDILKEYSDEDHRLTQQEIIKLLKHNYDMECDRRSVKNNILYLKELGYDISMDNGYFLIERNFEDAELRMLIDCVLFSNQLTHKQAKDLIEKLRSQGNRYFNAKVTHINNLPNLQHSDNKQIMYVLDTLNDAITTRKKISFLYNDYGKDLKLHPRHEEAYVVNPYQIVASNGKFYLIGNYDKYDNVSHYRIDRISCIEILPEHVKPQKDVKGLEHGLNLPKHMAEHVYMFSGESVRVRFLAKKRILNELVDWFGHDFQILEDCGEDLLVKLSCNEMAFKCWALQYGPSVEVLEPQELRSKVKEMIQGMYEKYSR